MTRPKSLLLIAFVLGLPIIAGLVYWLWPQINIAWDILTQKYNF